VARKCPASANFTDALPKGGTGKVQKSALRARWARVKPWWSPVTGHDGRKHKGQKKKRPFTAAELAALGVS